MKIFLHTKHTTSFYMWLARCTARHGPSLSTRTRINVYFDYTLAAHPRQWNSRERTHVIVLFLLFQSIFSKCSSIGLYTYKRDHAQTIQTYVYTCVYIRELALNMYLPIHPYFQATRKILLWSKIWRARLWWYPERSRQGWPLHSSWYSACTSGRHMLEGPLIVLLLC